jgi:hypothetical protein
MSDEFLERLREPPRPEFARELYRRLERRPTPPRQRRRLGLGLAALALLLALGGLLNAATSPDARIAQTGGLGPDALVLAASAHQSALVLVLETQSSERMHLPGSCAGCPRDLSVRRAMLSHHR